jgi:ribosomal protein L16 Arg81 hydroxylase
VEAAQGQRPGHRRWRVGQQAAFEHAPGGD